MTDKPTNLDLSLEQLSGWSEGDPNDAPTPMIAAIQRSWKKPLRDLSDHEIGRLVVQHYGYPYLLDLVWPKLERDPLFDGGYYPGAVLSMLMQASPEIWVDRPDYREALQHLYQRALERSSYETNAFRKSLKLSDTAFRPS